MYYFKISLFLRTGFRGSPTDTVFTCTLAHVRICMPFHIHLYSPITFYLQVNITKGLYAGTCYAFPVSAKTSRGTITLVTYSVNYSLA